MGRLDTGAEDNFFRQSTAKRLKLNTFANEHTTTVEFGNGNQIATSLAAHLNESLSALIIPDTDLVHDLLSVIPILDLGYDIKLTAQGGSIDKNEVPIMPIVRDDRKLLVDIKRVQCLMACTKSQTIRDKVLMLHRRMGHPSMQRMVDAINNGSWRATDVTSCQVKEIMSGEPCIACALGKQNHSPIPKIIKDARSTPIGWLVSGDIIGPIKPTARCGAQYFYLFVDRRTSHLTVFTSATKDGFITSLKKVYDTYKALGHKMHAFRSDSESIMVSGNVEDFLENNHVKQEFSLPYEHHQNIVERHVQTVVKTTTAVLHDQQYLNATFWNYALFYTVTSLNNRPNTKTDGQTPEQMVCNAPPLDLSRTFLFPFGTPVSVRKPKPEWRFDVRRDLGIFLGNAEGSVNGGLIYLPGFNSICTRGDLTELRVSPNEFARYSNVTAKIKGLDDTTEDLIIPYPHNEPPDVSNLQEDDRQATIKPLDHSLTKPQHKISKPISRREIKSYVRRMLTRSQSSHGSKLSALLARYVNELDISLDGPDKLHWQQALQEEVNSLFNVTETIIPETPEPGSEHDIISVTVVLKKKMLDATKVDKYKVRICACGNQLLLRHDYQNETFSPTVSSLVHSLLLQLAITDRMHTATFDTVAAYLHQEYPSDLKPLYLRFPKRLAQACNLNPDNLYRVKKYLYGLPDAGRAYYLALHSHLTEHGYNVSIHDSCLFYKINAESGLRVLIWTHVDDLFCAASHPEEIQTLNDILSRRFPVKINYSIDSHLGINMETQENGSVKLTQPKLLGQIFQNYPNATTDSKYPATQRSNKIDTTPVSQHDYLQLLGKLLYMTNSRPDIMTATSYAATKAKSPTISDYNDLLRIVNFLRDTPDHGLILYPNSTSTTDPDTKIKLVAYVDAAYMSHTDAGSHTGYCIALCPANSEPKSYFHSKSQKQKLISTSSTHAEVRALYQLTIQLVFITNLLNEIGRNVELPTTVYEDNKATIDLTTNAIPSNKGSKHFLMLTQFIRQQVKFGLMALKKVDGHSNLANVLTKIICGNEFEASYNQIMGLMPYATAK